MVIIHSDTAGCCYSASNAANPTDVRFSDPQVQGTDQCSPVARKRKLTRFALSQPSKPGLGSLREVLRPNCANLLFTVACMVGSFLSQERYYALFSTLKGHLVSVRLSNCGRRLLSSVNRERERSPDSHVAGSPHPGHGRRAAHHSAPPGGAEGPGISDNTSQRPPPSSLLPQP